jgi:hypothetical protein
MNKTRIAVSVLAIAFGVFLFIFGGYDDSPGAQGLGLLVVIAGGVSAYKAYKK